ncbi:MAG: DUF4434 domain-containing protein [Flavobacteriaceae bacterium]
MKITATFIDEISHDIPHQNWGPKEWRQDFLHMKAIGIDTVVMIRCGFRKFLTYPSPYLTNTMGCFSPTQDLVKLFLELATECSFDFYFGIYDSGEYWDTGDMSVEIEVNKKVIEEAYEKYGQSPAFKGWYLSLELSRKTKGAVSAIRDLGHHAKEVSGGLPVLISPWIDGPKAVMAASSKLTKATGISLEKHAQEWDEIFKGIQGAIDIVAFQDGHLNFEDLKDYLALNKALADKYGFISWTNTESFDRDMPIKFFPIKFDKLHYKLSKAHEVGMAKAITFEFSHFMSPQSAYIQARHLYNRYMAHYLHHKKEE